MFMGLILFIFQPCLKLIPKILLIISMISLRLDYHKLKEYIYDGFKMKRKKEW